MARAAKILHNLNSVSEMVGALEGMMNGLDTDRYLNGLMVDAHERETERFDLTAAAAAQQAEITHVWEYGTAGVTRGKPVLADPTSSAARLYEHGSTGHGRRLNTFYTFRPAVMPNPPAYTFTKGVSMETLSKLSDREYIFWNKAVVVETGMRVDVQPQNVEKIFIPSSANFTVRNSRNFIFTPHGGTPRPGKTQRGKFNRFWVAYWATEGASSMQEYMEGRVESDVVSAARKEMAKARANSSKFTVPNPRASFNAYNKGRNRGKHGIEFAVYRGGGPDERYEVRW